MKVVIDIPSYDIERISNAGCIPDIMNYDIADAIIDGTPLPEGHGRIIDVDILDEVKEIVTTVTGDYKYAVTMDNIRLIPTIIEVDRR